MKESQVFFNDPQNIKRADVNIGILEDDKSRNVIEHVIRYRMFREPIPKNLYSENDQYFVDDLIQLNDEEVHLRREKGAAA